MGCGGPHAEASQPPRYGDPSTAQFAKLRYFAAIRVFAGDEAGGFGGDFPSPAAAGIRGLRREGELAFAAPRVSDMPSERARMARRIVSPSASETAVCGGIGTSPQTPPPPVLSLSFRSSSAPASARFSSRRQIGRADRGLLDLMAGEALLGGHQFLDFRAELRAAGIVAGRRDVAGADDDLRADRRSPLTAKVELLAESRAATACRQAQARARAAPAP